MGLCFFKQLAWKFSAETSTTLLIELIVALFAVRRANPNPNPNPKVSFQISTAELTGGHVAIFTEHSPSEFEARLP